MFLHAKYLQNNAKRGKVCAKEEHGMNDKQIYNRLWRDWVMPYKSRIIGALCLMVGVAATGCAYPAVIQNVFDAL